MRWSASRWHEGAVWIVALSRRAVAPHIYESADEASAHLRELEATLEVTSSVSAGTTTPTS